MINRQELLNTLNKLKPGISNKDIIQANTCFNLQNNKISSYNDEITISIPFKTDVSVLVNAELFLSVISKIPNDEIDLILSENELLIKADKIESGIAILDEKHPDIQIKGKWKKLPGDFHDALNFCSFSVSKDMTLIHLTFVHFTQNKVISSDTYRITEFTMSEESPFEFSIPFKVVEEIKKFKFIKGIKNKAWIHLLEENGTIFSFRDSVIEKRLTPEKVEKYFNVKGENIVFPEKFSEALDRAGIMCEGLSQSEKTIDIKVDRNKLTYLSKKEIGWIKETLKVTFKGKFEFSINPFLLKDILDKCNSAIISDTNCLFKSDNFRHVISLK